MAVSPRQELLGSHYIKKSFVDAEKPEQAELLRTLAKNAKVSSEAIAVIRDQMNSVKDDIAADRRELKKLNKQARCLNYSIGALALAILIIGGVVFFKI